MLITTIRWLRKFFKIRPEMLSPHNLSILQRFNGRDVPCKKLTPNLFKKSNYIVHYLNLQLYITLGLELVRITKGVQFKQNAWMKPYIDFNTDKRKLAKSDFEKDFFKLANNSVFGKSMENVKKYSDIKLVTSPEKFRHLSANPRYHSSVVFNDNLVAVMMNRARVRLCKPIFVGFTVLELSKHLMYDFHYNFIKGLYDTKAQLLFTDTDSLTYKIETPDVYEDMVAFRQFFDFSDYPPENNYHDSSNKKVMGKMKDETNGTAIEEFVGLRSKMYSIKCKNHSKLRAKGVSKNVVKNQIKHNDYKNVLAEGILLRHNMLSIRSKLHQLYTIRTNKISLCNFDNKRFICENGINTLAYGHYLIAHQ